MIKSLIALALLGTLPGPEPELRTGPIQAPSKPRLTPGYPPRQLYTREIQGQTVKIWGWVDTENVVHWFASENPHISGFPQATARVPNYGVVLEQSPTAVHRAATGATYQVGSLTTNDPAFGPAFYQTGPVATASGDHPPHPGQPCPGPGPCPNPTPPNRPNPFDPPAATNRDYLYLGAAGVVGVGLVIYRRRKGP